VLSGVQANDDSFGATGVALAEEVGFQWAAVVNQLDTGTVLEEGVASVHRELEGVVESSLDVTAMYEPETESDAEYLEGDADEQAARLADVLRDKGVSANDACPGRDVRGCRRF